MPFIENLPLARHDKNTAQKPLNRNNSSNFEIFIMTINNTYFLYGLQAATILRFLHNSKFSPSMVLSHMISFIRPIDSVVFASSKNKTVYM